jgi:hypothetical protein
MKMPKLENKERIMKPARKKNSADI